MLADDVFVVAVVVAAVIVIIIIATQTGQIIFFTIWTSSESLNC